MKNWKHDCDRASYIVHKLRWVIGEKMGLGIGIPQNILASMLGIAPSTLSNYEQKRRYPTIYMRNKIIDLAKTYGFDLKQNDFKSDEN